VTGKLIVLEGIDGAGTTTQAQRLGRELAAHVTREPSQGPVGRLIREVLQGHRDSFDQRALTLLFAADRLDHLQREVEPLLARGQHVVSDRYVLSSFAYQSRFVEADFVWQANAQARPADLTILLDVPAEVAAARRHARGGPAEMYEEDRLQAAIAQAYTRLPEWVRTRENLVVIDGTPDPDTVFAQVLAQVRSCLATSGTAS
jgi:dTMP kinase